MATLKIALERFHSGSIRPEFKENHKILDDRTIQSSAEKIAGIMAIICDNNLDTAAKVLASILKSKSYILVKNTFEGIYIPAIQKIISGISSFIKDHSNLPTGGTRLTAQQNAVDAVVFAAVWDLGKEKRLGREFSKLIGVRLDNIIDSMHTAAKMKECGERFKPKQRKICSDNVQEMSYTSIQKRQHSDQNTRIDTNTWREQKSMNPFTNEEQCCARRIWSVIGSERQYQLFEDSPEYREFQMITNNASIGLTTFKSYLCPCTRTPTAESCVDPLISGVQHLMAAIKDGLGRLPDTSKETLTSLPGFATFTSASRKGRGVEMVEACCCSREENHYLKTTDTTNPPKLLKFSCCNGQCSICGLERRFGEILHHPYLINSELQLTVCIWEEVQRQGEKNGVQNTQLELSSREMGFSSILNLFQLELRKCLPHIFKIEWMNTMHSIDISTVGNNNFVIMTDFSATLDLRARETVNSSVDSHAFLDNFVVISNHRKAFVSQRHNDEAVTTEISLNDCDVYQFLGSTMSKGKKRITLVTTHVYVT